MPVKAFDEGKNKEDVYTKSESDEKNLQMTTVIVGKQDKHQTATATLLAANWSSKTQTVDVTGVTTTNTVLVSASANDILEYANFGVICTAQGAGTLTFTCEDVPENDLTINVVILGV